MPPIYLDYNATTPIDPAVLDAMLPFLQTHFGNPSSTHAYGKTAHDAIDNARAQVASLIGAQSDEIVFTGGGTEASNHAIKGAIHARMSGFFARWFTSPHIITSAIEHPATLMPREPLAEEPTPEIAALLSQALRLEGFFPEFTVAQMVKLFPRSGLYRYPADFNLIKQGDAAHTRPARMPEGGARRLSHRREARRSPLR